MPRRYLRSVSSPWNASVCTEDRGPCPVMNVKTRRSDEWDGEEGTVYPSGAKPPGAPANGPVGEQPPVLTEHHSAPAASERVRRGQASTPLSGQRAFGVWVLVGSQKQIPPLPVFPLQCQTLGSRQGPPFPWCFSPQSSDCSVKEGITQESKGCGRQ